MRSLLVGFAGVSPKSAVPNLVQLFSALIAKAPLESKVWILDVLHGVRVCFSSCKPFFWWVDSLLQSDFAQSRAGTEAKDALVKAVFGYEYNFPCHVQVI
jgi:hypothetical protein